MKTILTGLVALIGSGMTWAGPVDKPVDAILKDYFTIQSALASDTTEGIDKAAESIHHTAGSIEASEPEVQALISQIQKAAHGIQGQDLEAARTTFFELSKPLLVYLNQFHSGKDGYHRFFCPMAKKGWIQSETETRNPYYGSSMLSCGQMIE